MDKNTIIIQKTLELVKENLEFYIENIFKEIYGEKYILYLNNSNDNDNHQMIDYLNIENNYRKKFKDVLYFINLFLKFWETIFKPKIMNNYSLTLIHSIRYFRNRWAHQCPLNGREVYRLVDESLALFEELKFNKNENLLNDIRLEALENLVHLEINNSQNKIIQDLKNNSNLKIENNQYTNPNNFVGNNELYEIKDLNSTNLGSGKYLDEKNNTNNFKNNYAENIQNYFCDSNNYPINDNAYTSNIVNNEIKNNSTSYSKYNLENNIENLNKEKNNLKQNKSNNAMFNYFNENNFIEDKQMVELDQIELKNKQYEKIIKNNMKRQNNDFNVYICDDK